MRKGRKGVTKHGLSKTSAWRSWNAMLTRCTNVNAPNYYAYGGRGIKVCKRWASFLNFIADMGSRPEGTSLDRVNNNGDYEPNNCRWATEIQQQRNRSNTRLLTVGKQTMPVSAWAETTGISVYTIFTRLRRGWPPQRAVTLGRANAEK